MTTKRLQNKPQQAVEPLKGLVIGQNWRVGADTLNIILYQRQVNKKTGKEYWRAHSYFASNARRKPSPWSWRSISPGSRFAGLR